MMIIDELFDLIHILNKLRATENGQLVYWDEFLSDSFHDFLSDDSSDKRSHAWKTTDHWMVHEANFVVEIS